MWQNVFVKLLNTNDIGFLRFYEKVYKWYQMGYIENDVWDNYCMNCLQELMKKNKKVLDNLKNV